MREHGPGVFDGIIGDAPVGAIPFHRLFDVGDSLRRHVYAACDERTPEQRATGGGPRNLNPGIDVGATRR